MSSGGADFSDVQPRGQTGEFDANTMELLFGVSSDLDAGIIQQVTPNNSFRIGQQVLFWLTVANPIVDSGAGPNWISTIRLKPWWARPNLEYRQAFGGDGAVGSTGSFPVDTTAFGDGAVVGDPLKDNRNVWIPSVKRLDVTQFQAPPPPASPARHSDSLMLDDLWTMDFQNPNDPMYAGKFGPTQTIGRRIAILYPALGYALGFTYEITEGSPGASPIIHVEFNLSWQTGTFGGGGRIQESVG